MEKNGHGLFKIGEIRIENRTLDLPNAKHDC
jgi:hypothetical protein